MPVLLGPQAELGAVLHRLGDLPAAQKTLKEACTYAVRLQSPECEPLSRLARLLLEQGDLRLAQEHARQGVEASR